MRKGVPGREITCAKPLMFKIISECSRLTSILSSANSTQTVFFFMPIETTNYGPVSILAFSSTCPIESLRILGSLYRDKVTGLLLYPVGNRAFTHGRKICLIIFT